MSIITPESKIEELGLSQHAAGCLKKAGVFFVCDLLQKAGADLRVHCDEPAFNEIEEVLARASLHIGEGIGG
jgi:Bacterial RNA polymerase, alpha chain C terminal domain